jgi:hypothetical protein
MFDLFPFLWIFVIGIAIAFSIITRKNRENQKTSWKRLAATHHLTYVPDNSYFSNGGHVTGTYQGYPLKLETIEKKQGKSSITYTRITLFARQWPNDPPGQPLSFRETLKRFTSPNFRYGVGGEIKVEPSGQPIAYEQREVIQDTQFLTYLFDLLISLAEAYPIVVAGGGEAVASIQPTLDDKPLGQLALQLLRDITQATTGRLAYRVDRLLCPRCLTRFGSHEIHLSWLSNLTYYGCRMCAQSQNFYEGPVIAVLNSGMTATPVERQGVVRINWSARRELFDFDAIEIVQATDEEVERFAVQVGNDTDPTRQPRYESLHCAVHPNCGLSENTLRILRRTFGQVDVKLNQDQIAE